MASGDSPYNEKGYNPCISISEKGPRGEDIIHIIDPSVRSHSKLCISLQKYTAAHPELAAPRPPPTSII